MLWRICPFMMTHHSAVPTWKCPLSFGIVGRQIFLVAPDRLRPHVVVLDDVLAGELRILLGVPEIEVRLVVARIRRRRRMLMPIFIMVWPGACARPRVGHRHQRLEVRLIGVHPERRSRCR